MAPSRPLRVSAGGESARAAREPEGPASILSSRLGTGLCANIRSCRREEISAGASQTDPFALAAGARGIARSANAEASPSDARAVAASGSSARSGQARSTSHVAALSSGDARSVHCRTRLGLCLGGDARRDPLGCGGRDRPLAAGGAGALRRIRPTRDPNSPALGRAPGLPEPSSIETPGVFVRSGWHRPSARRALERRGAPPPKPHLQGFSRSSSPLFRRLAGSGLL